ncbi:hypothetical protein tinsulaeT_04560 [Thalassotalea insulae]|uniref:Solute-binding protein family 3/N-terminal domain-containing protein n=1 Tax=Thalassotalea insulae TaxID=2056778 RepID=A0ABQ6GR14_9GAMM|nr:transporter substrate-binding domain-containing protein [Thalassotalea insulae]GLX77116.1 hypothetical protein tinsulaeT_04560 [Thalassotalea insulae]
MKKSLLLLCSLVAFFVNAQTEVNLVTELYPPFQQMNKRGEVTGVATNLVKKLFNQAGLTPNITVYPWARALREFRRSPNTLLFSMLQLPSRAKQYKWLVPLCTITMSFYHHANRNDITINKLIDVKNYRIGVERAQGNKEYLIAQGFEDNLIEVNNNEQLRKMMLFDRIDLVLISDAYATTIAKTDDIKLSKAFTVNSLEQQLYLVGNQALSKTIEQNILNAYQLLSKNNQFQCHY